MATVAELKGRTGFHAWLAWYDGLADWRAYGARNPLVRPNVPLNVKLMRPLWFPRRAAWWRARRNLQDTPVQLSGVIRTLGSCTVDHPEGKAFLAAGGKRLMVQFADPVNDASNRSSLTREAQRWRNAGVALVEGWWRINHSSADTPPNVIGLDGWWPNAEEPNESARLPRIYNSPCAGAIVLGKQPGVWPPSGGLLALECFRENALSDHTVDESVSFWTKSGLPLSRMLVLLQMYGVPYAPVAVQAARAYELGVRHMGFYPLDGADPQQIAAVAAAVR